MRRHFNACRDYAILHTTSGPKVAYWSSAHILLTLPPSASHNSQHVSLHKKSVVSNHCSNGQKPCEDTLTQVATMRYPTPHQGQKSPTGHQPIFYSRSHQGLLITPKKFLCTKKCFLINHCSNGRVLWRRHFNASRDYALFTPHHIRAKSRLLVISAYFTHAPTKGFS